MLDVDLFSRVTDKIYIADVSTYEVLYANPSLVKALGFKERQEVEGRKCYEVLQGNSAPCEFCTNNLLTEGVFYEWEKYNSLLDKTFLNQDILIHYNGRLCRMEISKDLEKQKEMEYFYEKLGNEVLGTALKEDDITVGIEKAIGLLGEKMNADRIYIFERFGNSSSNTYEWCAEGVTSEKDGLQNIPDDVMEPWYKIFRAGGEVFIKDLEDIKLANPDIYDYLEPQNISTLVALPIFVRKELKGFFGVDNIEKSRMGSLTKFMKTMATYVGDLIEKKDNRHNLERLSKFDPLTDLYNRKAAERMINEALTESVGILLIIDLDKFKLVNDWFGHQRGDALLQEVAEKMKSASRESDVVFRLGGDEFGIYYRHLVGENAIAAKCEQLRKLLEITVEDGDKKVEVSASIGVAVADRRGELFTELYANADSRLYKAKDSGRNRACYKDE